MTEPVLLVGASGLAREVLAAGVVGVRGILDDDATELDRDLAGYPILGPAMVATERSEQLLLCVGSGDARREIVQRLAARGIGRDRYATYIAPSVRIGVNSVVGAGTILLDGVVITADATVGDHVVVMPNCTITHDDTLEDFVTLAAGVALGGGVRLREAAYLGMNASVRPGAVIGSSATVGMGAAVLTDVPPRRRWAGVPARDLEAAE